MTTSRTLTVDDASPAVTRPARTPVWRRLLHLRESGLLAVVAAILVLLWLGTDTFVTVDNLLIVGRQAALVLIIALGMTFVILTGGIDLSVGSVVALTSVATGFFVITADLPYGIAVTASVATGLVCGLVNGAVIRYARIPPFIVTLGMLSVARGLALGLTGGSTKTGFGAPFLQLGQGSLLGVPLPIWIAGVLAVAAHIVLSRTILGRQIYYLGSNEHAARLSGIRVDRIRVFVYALCGTLAALAGVLETSRLAVAQPSAGAGYELTAIGAVIIGGASLFGGSGSVLGTVLGTTLLTLITNGLIALNVSAYWQQVFQGLVIVLAVALNELRGRRGATARA